MNRGVIDQMVAGRRKREGGVESVGLSLVGHRVTLQQANRGADHLGLAEEEEGVACGPTQPGNDCKWHNVADSDAATPFCFGPEFVEGRKELGA